MQNKEFFYEVYLLKWQTRVVELPQELSGCWVAAAALAAVQETGQLKTALSSDWRIT